MDADVKNENEPKVTERGRKKKHDPAPDCRCAACKLARGEAQRKPAAKPARSKTGRILLGKARKALAALREHVDLFEPGPNGVRAADLLRGIEVVLDRLPRELARPTLQSPENELVDVGAEARCADAEAPAILEVFA